MPSEERVTMREAAAILGVSHAKMWQLVKEGVVSAEPNPLDRRQKLLRRADLETLKGEGRAHHRFASDGIAANPDAVPSSRIKDWVRQTWHRPC
jgi:predicted DNA-binding transcriptional regulator AlpA